jgi:hypothetical protein
MANRYWKPQKADTPYHKVDRHIPLPFEEMAAVLKERQNQYDTTSNAQLAEQDKFNKFQTRGIDAAGKNHIIGEYENEIKSVLDQHGGDYGAAGRDLDAVARKYSQNEYWNRAKDAYTQEEAYNKFANEAKAQGKTVLDFNRKFKETAVYDPQTGQYNDVGSWDSAQGLDYGSRMSNDMKLHADTFGTALQQAGGDIQGYLKYATVNGISDGKVRRAVDEGYTRYMHSDEGRQHTRKLIEIDGMSAGQAQQEIKNGLLAAGMQQVHSNVTPHYMADQEYAYEQKAKAAKAKAEKEQADNAPMLVRNNTNKGMDTKASDWWGSSDISVPTFGESSRAHNKEMKQYKPTGRSFVFGEDANADEGEGMTDARDVIYHKMVVGYKIIDPNHELKGSPLSKGGDDASVISDADNNVKREGSKFYVYGEGGKKYEVAPQAYKKFSDVDGNVILEEPNTFESYQELGRNLSGQNFIDFEPTDAGTTIVKTNFTSHDAVEYLDFLPRNEVMYALKELSRIEQTGIQDEEDAQLVETVNQYMEEGMKRKAQSRNIIAKDSYTAKGSLGERETQELEEE